jgi:hypothetical protein
LDKSLSLLKSHPLPIAPQVFAGMNTLQRKLITQISDSPLTNKLCTQRQLNWHTHDFEKKKTQKIGPLGIVQCGSAFARYKADIIIFGC